MIQTCRYRSQFHYCGDSSLHQPLQQGCLAKPPNKQQKISGSSPFPLTGSKATFKCRQVWAGHTLPVVSCGFLQQQRAAEPELRHSLKAGQDTKMVPMLMLDTCTPGRVSTLAEWNKLPAQALSKSASCAESCYCMCQT